MTPLPRSVAAQRAFQAGAVFLVALLAFDALRLYRLESGVSPSRRAALLLNPNTATRDELLLLPGVGEKLADNIVAYRESLPNRPAFAAASDLDRVERIGPATIEKLKPFLTFCAGPKAALGAQPSSATQPDAAHD